MTHSAHTPLLTFYGDDLTGSTDMLESLAVQGLRSALFLEAPSPDLLGSRFADLDVLGVAGMSRTMTPEQMDVHLTPIFERLRAFGAPLCIYKICSTFDSSPGVGSIGRAIEIGRRVFAGPFVPLVVGAPTLRRYCLFGNLFATVGDHTYRLDRHPTMSRHPITPMHESDLRLHLACQTELSIGLMDILDLSGNPATVDAHLAALLTHDPAIVLFDVLDEPHLSEVGRLIWEQSTRTPLFVAGSSGVGYALTAHWRGAALLPGPRSFDPPGAAEQILVLSGSCSPVTAQQIRWALAHGFDGILLSGAALVDAHSAASTRGLVVRQAVEALNTGRSVIIYTALGPNDPAIGETGAALERIGADPRQGAVTISAELGAIARQVLERAAVRRAVVAGGDSAGQVAQALGISALEMAAPLVPGGPFCRASAHNPRFDGMLIVLKGGQVGTEDLFGRVLEGV